MRNERSVFDRPGGRLGGRVASPRRLLTLLGLTILLVGGSPQRFGWPQPLELPNPVFTDVTLEAGVDYLQYQLPDPPLVYEPIYMAGGAAAGDYDGDGWVDLYVTRLGAHGILFRNLGNGTFQDVTAQAGLALPILTGNGAAWGDIDNDADLDLYQTSLFGTSFFLFVNDGAGGFTEQAVARGAAVASPDIHFGYSVTFGDYNQDGWLDIHTTEWRPNGLNPSGAPANARLLRNRGSAAPGFFEDVTVSAGVALDGISPNGSFSFASRLTDLNDDGWPDLAIASDFGTSRLFWNNRDGTFTDGTVAAGVGSDENGMGSAIGDYDGDGDLDWFVTSIFDPERTCDTQPCGWGYTGNRLYRNEGDGTFSDQTDAAGVRDGYWGWGAAFLDYDNDADLDLVMTNGVDFPNNLADQRYVADPMRLWRNEGGGVMSEVSASSNVTDNRSGKGLLTFDYDRDGDLDLFVVNNAGHPVLYRNDGGNASGWLRLKTVGWRNKLGLGARIEVTPVTGGPSQMHEVNAGSHFLGQSELTAHFGLGEGAAPVAEVRVRWPQTLTLQTLRDLPRNTTVVVEEPEPPVFLRINGAHPDSRVVTTAGPVHLTLDVVPGPFTQPLDWYFGVAVGNELFWVTPGGPSPTPVPAFQGAPLPLEGQTLLDTSLPTGTNIAFILLLAEGDTVVAVDYLRAQVS